MSRILKLRCGLSELSRSQAMTSGSSDRLPLWLGDRRKASIFVRKTLQVRLRDQKRECVFKLEVNGSAFFDEDGVSDGF